VPTGFCPSSSATTHVSTSPFQTSLRPQRSQTRSVGGTNLGIHRELNPPRLERPDTALKTGPDERPGMSTRRAFLSVLGAVAVAGCRGDTGSGATPTGQQGTATPTGATAAGNEEFALTSPAFGDGDPIPPEFTGDGADVSPPLSIEGVPDDAASLALVVDDPDAPGGRFVHWLLWNVPASVTAIPRGVARTERVGALDGAVQGTNGFGAIGYRGPLPPEGDGAHSYVFTLRALGRVLDLDPGAGRSELESATSGTIIGTTRLRGTYER